MYKDTFFSLLLLLYQAGGRCYHMPPKLEIQSLPKNIKIVNFRH